MTYQTDTHTHTRMASKYEVKIALLYSKMHGDCQLMRLIARSMCVCMHVIACMPLMQILAESFGYPLTCTCHACWLSSAILCVVCRSFDPLQIDRSSHCRSLFSCFFGEIGTQRRGHHALGPELQGGSQGPPVCRSEDLSQESLSRTHLAS